MSVYKYIIFFKFRKSVTDIYKLHDGDDAIAVLDIYNIKHNKHNIECVTVII